MNNDKNSKLMPPSSNAPGIEARIERALEQKPQPPVPADFAARVAARAVAQPLRRRRSAPQFGRFMALLSAVVAAIALFALAPHASAANIKNLSFDAEVLLLAELALIGGWLARLSSGGSTTR